MSSVRLLFGLGVLELLLLLLILFVLLLFEVFELKLREFSNPCWRCSSNLASTANRYFVRRSFRNFRSSFNWSFSFYRMNFNWLSFELVKVKSFASPCQKITVSGIDNRRFRFKRVGGINRRSMKQSSVSWSGELPPKVELLLLLLY